MLHWTTSSLSSRRSSQLVGWKRCAEGLRVFAATKGCRAGEDKRHSTALPYCASGFEAPDCSLGCSVSSRAGSQAGHGSHHQSRLHVSNALADVDVEAEAAAAVSLPLPAAAVSAPREAGKPATRRGRPCGTAAWNKGRGQTEETRLKISRAQKLRYQDGGELKKGMRAKLLGKTPWNLGLAMGADTRAKMAAAHLGLAHRRSTRAKMSASHMGKTISTEAAAKVSASLKGLAKSPAHKAAIAATMRRRHAAVRVLRAVEEVHRQHSLAHAGGEAAEAAAGAASPDSALHPASAAEGMPEAAPVAAADSARSTSTLGGARIPAGIAGSPHLGSGGSRRLSKGQILNGYKAQLHEYRVLQQELAPWTKAFADKHGRKPRLLDVERTGVEWLTQKYKLYVMLRERLLMDTPQLRGSVTKARPGPESLNDPAFQQRVLESSSMAEPMNANTSTAGPSSQDASLRFKKALQYRASKAAAVVEGESLTVHADVTGAAELNTLLESIQRSETAARGSGGSEQERALNPGSLPATSDGTTPIQRGLPDLARRPIKSMPINAPQRVQSAMAAALEYRQRQMAAASAAATAAADAAQKPPAQAKGSKSPEAMARVLAAARAAKAKKGPRSHP